MADDMGEMIEELRAFERSHRIQARDGFRPDHAELADRYGKYAGTLVKLREQAAAAQAKLDEIARLLGQPTDERGITWWEWIKEGLGGSLHEDLRHILSASDSSALNRVRAETLREAARRYNEAFVDEQQGIGPARVLTSVLFEDADRIEGTVSTPEQQNRTPEGRRQ